MLLRRLWSRTANYIWPGLAFVLSVPASAATISFTDNFSPPSSLWSNSTGNWTASGGQYVAQQPNNNPGATTVLPFDLTSYTLTVTVNGLGDGGIVVRQGITLVLGGLGYGQGARGGNAGTAIYWGDGNNPQQNQVNGVFIPGNTYTITVTDVGNTFSAFINGSSTPVTTITDSIAGPDGVVGLYDDQPNTTTGNGFGTPTTFSNFSLTGTTVSTVPESSSELLLGLGLIILAIGWHKARRQNQEVPRSRPDCG